ncbi:MAG: GNAT family N-acetyltransferase [Pirellulaceae bacterium]
MTDWIIEPLSAKHDRSHFDCGVTELNDWLRLRASQFDRRDLARTYVATVPGESVCAGYHSLSTHHVIFESLPPDASKGLPSIDVPVALLGKLAVCKSQQGYGLGEHLLLDAMRRIVSIAEKIGIRAIEVDAINESARKFYSKYGFQSLNDDERHLFLPIQVVRKLNLPPY